MKFICKFNMNNVIFDNNLEFQTSQILKQIAFRIEKGETFGTIQETNGNTIGKWEIKTD